MAKGEENDGNWVLVNTNWNKKSEENCDRLCGRLFRRLGYHNRDTQLRVFIRSHYVGRYYLLSRLRHKEFPQIQKAQDVFAADRMIDYYDTVRW